MKFSFHGFRVKGLYFVTIILLCATVFVWILMQNPILRTFPGQGRFEQAQVGWGEDEERVEKLKEVPYTKGSDSGENRIEERGKYRIGEEETDSGESGKRERKKEEEIIGRSINEGAVKEERSNSKKERRKEGEGNEETRRNETTNVETGKGKNGPVRSEESASKRNAVKECNYAKGKWIVDHNQTLYSGFGCKQWLSEMWSCRSTRRTDFAYENIRWQPKDCQLERFEGSKFLRSLQGKTLAFVGDSLGRQQFQSLICMITGGKDKHEIVDVGEEWGFPKPHGHSRPGGWALRFPSTNATVLYHWSACLCDIQPMNTTNPNTDFAMHLDRPAAFLTKNIHRINVLVLNTAHHWNRGKLKANRWVMHVRGGLNSDRHLQQIWKARNLTVHSVIKWADGELSNYPGLKVFYRTISPRHFSGGEWNTGGSCDNTTPMSIGKEIEKDDSSDEVAASAVKGTRVKLLDITALSSLRDEAHISRFRGRPDSAFSDCLHWCMPGVPDTWNEILAAQL